MIGKKGNVIQEILEKSRVHNVKVVGDDEAKEREIDIQMHVCHALMGGVSDKGYPEIGQISRVPTKDKFNAPIVYG